MVRAASTSRASINFYQIRVHDPDAIGAGNYTQTRKMVLMK